MKADRFPSCDRWHPGADSLLRTYHSVHPLTKTPILRWHCLICDKYRRAKPPRPRAPKINPRDPYGVVHLLWKPPRAV